MVWAGMQVGTRSRVPGRAEPSCGWNTRLWLVKGQVWHTAGDEQATGFTQRQPGTWCAARPSNNRPKKAPETESATEGSECYVVFGCHHLPQRVHDAARQTTIQDNSIWITERRAGGDVRVDEEPFFHSFPDNIAVPLFAFELVE